jgi:hypothetical protein
MSRSVFRVAVAVAALLTAVVVAIAPGAGAAAQEGVHDKPAPDASYVLDVGTSVSENLSFEDFEFKASTSCTEEGNWASQGTNIALLIVDGGSCPSEAMEQGEIMLGTIRRHGRLSSEAVPGTSAPDGTPWYATKADEPSASTAKPAGGATPKAAAPSGTYDEYSVDEGHVTITFTSDPDYFTTSSGDSGRWVTNGNELAFGVITPGIIADQNCVYLGVVRGRMINSQRKQGPVQCDRSPTDDTWYAKKSEAH